MTVVFERPRHWCDFVDLVLFCVGLAGLVLVAGRYAHPFPYWDDWRFCDYFQGQSYWQFIRTPHNEHNLWLYKAMVLPLVELTKWDNRSLVRLGLLIYAAANLSLFLLIRRQTASPLLRCAAALFLVLPGMYQNLVWAWQTQFHLCLLFGVMALWSLQLAATAGRRVVLLGCAAVFGVLALFAVGGGVAFALGIAVGLVLIVLVGATRRPAERWTAVLGASLLVMSVAYYLRISPHPAYHEPVLLPWKRPLVVVRSLVTGFGLGLSSPLSDETDLRAGFVGMAVIAAGALAACRKRIRRSSLVVVPAALVVALLAPAMVAVARPSFVRESRYMEINMIAALPLFWALGRIHAQRWAGWKVLAVALALAVPINAARNLRNEVLAMRGQYESLKRTADCFGRSPGSRQCLTGLYPFPGYVSGCLEFLHHRWQGWGHLGDRPP